MLKHRILYGRFPFLEKPYKQKPRPLLCLTQAIGKNELVVVAYMTTSSREELETDIKVDGESQGFKHTGLKGTTYIKLHKLGSLPLGEIESEVGILPRIYSLEVKKKLKKLLGI